MNGAKEEKSAPLKVLFAGTPANAARSLEIIDDYARQHGNFEIAAVLTRQDAPVGRKRVLTPSPVAQEAEARSIPTIKANRVDEEVLEALRETGVRAAAVVAYGALLRQEALEALDLGWFNLHYSLLPAWRGAAPVQRSIMAQEAQTGATIFRIDEGLDTGPIMDRFTTEITASTTAGQLLEHLTEEGSTRFASLLDALAQDPALVHRAEPQPLSAKSAQDHGEPSYAHKISSDDARIDLRLGSKELSAQIRGLLPSPGAWVDWQGEKFKILGIEGIEENSAAEEGSPLSERVGLFEPVPEGLRVFCGQGALILNKVQPFGKKAMNPSDWYRGLGQGRVTSEMRFSSEP